MYVYISNAVSHLHPNPAPVSSTNSNHNQDNVEPSLAAQDINPIVYVLDLIFAPRRAGFVPGSVQLISLVPVLVMVRFSFPNSYTNYRLNKLPLLRATWCETKYYTYYTNHQY